MTIRKQTLFHAFSKCFDTPEKLLSRVLSDGSHSCKRVLVKADHKNGMWYIALSQTSEEKPSRVEAAVLRPNGVIQVAGLTTDEAAKDKTIDDFYAFLDKNALDADLVQGTLYSDLEQRFKDKPSNTLCLDIHRSKTDVGVPSVFVDMVYKSERTAFLGKNYKILGLVVRQDEQRELWGVLVNAEHRVEGPGLNSPTFQKIMALYRSSNYEGLVDLLLDLQSKQHAWFTLLRSPDVNLPAAFCTSLPKSQDDPPVYDTEVSPGKFYVIDSEERGMDGKLYYNLVVNGVTLSRPANNFMKIRETA